MTVADFIHPKLKVDADGHLADFSDWCPEWVSYVKNEQNIPELTEDHWRLIHILQAYYREHGKPPMARSLTQATGFKMTRIFELFPLGPGKGACKLAGLPKPQGCV